jgi:tetratricopeptide (TPR) repeat protein
MQTKSLKQVIACCGGLIVAGLLLVTVWGQTLQVFRANQFFKARVYDKAENIYEDLAVDLPASPVISHNLGLCLYQVGLYERAVTSFTKCIPKKNLTSPELISKMKNAYSYYYHLANALYKAASRNGIETANAIKLYAAALDNYKKALIANPADFAAKYNYELTTRQLQHLATKPKTEQNPQQEAQDLIKNTQNSEQYKAKLIQDNNPSNGKDW